MPPPHTHLAGPKDIFDCAVWGGAAGIWWVQTREAAQHLAFPRLPPPLPAACQWWPAEKPCSAVIFTCSALWDGFSATRLSRWRGQVPVPSRCAGLRILKGNWKCEGHIQGILLHVEQIRGAGELAEADLPAQLSSVSHSPVRFDCAEVSPEAHGLKAAPLISFLSSAI